MADPGLLPRLVCLFAIEGYLSDPIHGGNKDMAAWKMIGSPGAHYDYSEWVDRHQQNPPTGDIPSGSPAVRGRYRTGNTHPLRGKIGDHIDVLAMAIGFNLRKILRRIRSPAYSIQLSAQSIVRYAKGAATLEIHV